MALNFNSNSITQVNWNGNSLTQVNFNGVKVWPEVTPVEPNYFYIKNNDAENSYQFYFNAPNGDETAYTPELYYSTDKTTWTQYYLNTTITLTPGQKCYFKAGTNGNNGFSTSETDCWHFQHNAPSAGIISIGGDLTTVMNENGGVTNTGTGYNFCHTFRNDNSGDVAGLQWPKIGIDNTFVIPFTTIGDHTFDQFGKGAFHSSYFPDLSHVTTVGSFAFFNSFNYCDWTGAITVDLTGVTTITSDTQFQNFMAYAQYNQTGSIIAYFGQAFMGTQRVYRFMFRQNSIPMEVHVPWTSWPNGSNATQSWLEGVTGTFYCPSALGTNETITRDNNHCPSGMTVINTDVNYFYVQAWSGESDLKFKFENAGSNPQPVNWLISSDKTNWSTFQADTYYTVPSGSKMYIKAGTGGNAGTANNSDISYSRLHFYYLPDNENETSLAIIGGDITTLLNENGLSDMRTTGTTGNFRYLFRNKQGDGSGNFRQFYLANDFEIPCTVIQPWAFHQCFRGALAPVDIVNNLSSHFPDLSNLEYVGPYSFGTAWCYENGVHFSNNFIVDLSKLKGSTDGTNLIDDCTYLNTGSNQGTFRNWLRYERSDGSYSYKVKVGPLEPYYYLYDGAFQDSGINEMEVAFSSFGSGTSNWLSSVAGTGTFKCPSALGDDETISRGNGACPAGWTVVNTD